MIVRAGVDYDALDDEPVHMIFLIAAPNTKDNIHLDVLGRLSMLLMDEKFREDLMQASSVEEYLDCIDKAEREKCRGEEEKQIAAKEKQAEKKKYQILAVTACPTGIAHTYMAAESLEKTAKELGYTIKVETNGSGGDKNVLTAQEIEECDCIIVAADKDVKMERFVRLYCNEHCRQTCLNAWNRGRTSCKGRNIRIFAGRGMDFLRIFWSAFCRIYRRIFDEVCEKNG